MSAASEREREEAIARLHEWLKPGDTVHCILRHVARSGMYRRISLLKLGSEKEYVRQLDGNVAAVLGLRWDRHKEGVGVSGCGMDMGFHLVYEMAHALWPEGHGCVGEGCPSNDHSNGDRDYKPNVQVLSDDVIVRDKMKRGGATDTHWHRDGGYALRLRWL